MYQYYKPLRGGGELKISLILIYRPIFQLHYSRKLEESTQERPDQIM